MAAFLSGVSGACYTPDKLALQDFFKFMDGARWHHNDHWDAEGGNDPCNFDTHWYGVGCIDPCDIYRDGYNCKAGRITALTLHDNNMTGSISNWTRVNSLTNLTWVDLSWNHISGSLPAEFGNIKNIEVLNMAWNKLEGTLPSELGNLNSNGYAELTEFNFAHNELEGTVPSELGQLSALRMFDVSFNKLSGSIPDNYTDWLQLQVMYLQGNSFQGTLPQEIGKLSDVRYLNASSNQISGTVPPSIGNMQVRPPSQVGAPLPRARGLPICHPYRAGTARAPHVREQLHGRHPERNRQAVPTSSAPHAGQPVEFQPDEAGHPGKLGESHHARLLQQPDVRRRARLDPKSHLPPVPVPAK